MLFTIESVANLTESRSGGAPRARRTLRLEEILSAAAGLFARRGFHGVSIDDVGAAVGMSAPGLYRHFPGKEAMLAEMLLEISQKLLDEGSRRTVAAPDARAALDAPLRWHIEFALSQPALITIQGRELPNVPEPARRRIRRLQRLYLKEWVSVLVELFQDTPQSRLRTAVHAMFVLLNSPRTAPTKWALGHGRDAAYDGARCPCGVSGAAKVAKAAADRDRGSADVRVD
jgi:AcrR family transcriptional regulator